MSTFAKKSKGGHKASFVLREPKDYTCIYLGVSAVACAIRTS